MVAMAKTVACLLMKDTLLEYWSCGTRFKLERFAVGMAQSKEI